MTDRFNELWIAWMRGDGVNLSDLSEEEQVLFRRCVEEEMAKRRPSTQRPEMRSFRSEV